MKINNIFFLLACTAVFGATTSGCADEEPKPITIDINVVAVSEDNDVFNFYSQYDASAEPQLITTGGDWSIEATFDKLGNAFISWSCRDEHYHYTTTTTMASGRPIISKDKENNIIIYELKEQKDGKNNDWYEVKIIKWDGRSFQDVKTITLPKIKKVPRGFYKKDSHARIDYIIQQQESDKFIALGGWDKEYLYLDGRTGMYWKTFSVLWNGTQWQNWQQIINEGKFGVKGQDIGIAQNGNIYSVWSEGDFPTKISFDIFDGQRWQGNREISGKMDLECREPGIAIDKSNNCHIFWVAKGKEDKHRNWKNQYYYVQYSNTGQWNDIEEYISDDYKSYNNYHTVNLILDSQGRPFIYWDYGREPGTVYCKTRVGNKLWSNTYVIYNDPRKGNYRH